MNIRNLLVPVDYCRNSEAAMAYAVSLAREHSTEIHLVHVYEPTFAYVDEGAGVVPLPVVPPADLNEARARLERIKPTEDVKFRREFLVGSPVNELVDYANKNAIDLIVMGTHGRTGLSRLLMGSVAEGVMRRSGCPVLTVRQPVESLQDA